MSYTTSFAAAGFLTAIPCFMLVYIILKYGNTYLHRIWAMFNLLVGLWGFACILIGNSHSYPAAINAWKFAFPIGFSISIVFYHTTLIFTKKSPNKLLVTGYLCVIIFFFLNIFFLGNEHFADVLPTFDSLYFLRATSLICLSGLLMWIFFAIIGLIDLLRYYQHADPSDKNKTLYFFLSMLVGFSGGTMNLLPMLNIIVFPYGNFSIPVYSAIVTYAFLKHELADIKIVIQKGVLYSILIATVSVLYLLTVFVLEKLIQQIFGYRSLFISVSTAFGLGLVFVPLRHRIQRFVDRYFFKGTSEEIALLNAQLRREIAQSDKYKTLGTLASGIAHEVKNPLTAIKTFTEYLPRKLEDKNFLRQFSRIVGKEVDRIDHLIHQLLNYSKPAPLSVKHINIHRLIGDTIDVLNNRFITQKIEVHRNFHDDRKLHLTVDPNQIRQALLNVLLNAIEAMPNGGKLAVKTTVVDQRQKTEDQRPLATGDGSRFTITVTDTGKGILPEDLKHIFDPFFSKKDEGTGLGLSIVQGILENHGGKVLVESQAGIGTEVVLEFPLEVH